MTEQKFKSKTDMVLYFLKGSWRFFIASVIFSVLTSFFDMLSPRIMGYAVDSFVSGKTGSGSTEVTGDVGNAMNAAIGVLSQTLFPGIENPAARAALLVLIAALLGAIFRYLYNLFNAYGAEHLVKTMRDRLFSHIEMLRYSWYMENATGDIIQRCTSDVETVKEFLSTQLTSILRIFIMIVIALSFMFSINTTLATVSLVFIPMILLYSVFFHARIGNVFMEADQEEGVLSTITQENLTGVRVVRAFGREQFERKRFRKQNDIYTAAYMKLGVLISAFWSVGDFFSGLQILCILALGASLTVQGRITAGDFIAFVSYNAMLSWPVRSLGRVISEMSKAGVSIERIRYIMNAEEEETTKRSTPPMDRDITFANVSFRYKPDAPLVLSDVSFTVPAGKTFGILGGTGSGKSTLMLLLDRLYPCTDGSIRIGDTDISDISLSYLRQNIGMVLQEPYLFSRTLGENIGIAREDATEQDIRRASDIASLTGAVRHFRKGFDTMVGERGVTLSGGQKQRTAIAQMIIRDTPIMVLDDSLSAVDAETDAKIRAALSEYMGKRTVILISHRISTLRAADQILVLKDGKVSGLGTHEELMQSNEIYRKVAEIQSAGLEEVYETVGSVTNKETDPPEGEPKETIAETNPARPDGQVAMDLEQKKEETGVSKAGEEAQHE